MVALEPLPRYKAPGVCFSWAAWLAGWLAGLGDVLTLIIKREYGKEKLLDL